MTRRAVAIGTVEKYPTRADALKASDHMRLTANPENPAGRPISFGTLIGRYRAEELPDRHSTRLAYTSYLDTHIEPKWGNYPLGKMVERGAPFSIEEWLTTLKSPETKKRLAAKTMGNIRNVMTLIFNCAMRWGLLETGSSPMPLVRVKGVSKRQDEPRILTLDEMRRLLKELSEPFRTMVVLAMVTGLRSSEAFALQWRDIEWENLTLLVRRAIVDGVVGEVKTKYSKAGMPLDPALAEILIHWRHESKFQRPEDWVFASWRTNGVLPFRSTAVLEDHIKPAAARAGLGLGIGWHTFRHTYSTMLRQLGVDLKVQQELLRHADIRTTMNVYTQAVSEDKRSAHSKVVRMVLATGT
ncbi:MAG: tyrosine-type recombinase/integrase [Terriglobales bacterium]